MDWKKIIESSKYFVSIVTNNFFKDVEAVEQALYAKELKKPTIILKERGVIYEIPDLFDNIILEIEFIDEEDFVRRKKEIAEQIHSVLKNQKID